jgi:hypothetical protein
MRTFRDQKGIALITALFFLIIMTVLASGAIMLAGVQLKVSGGISWWETGFAGGEGGINYIIPLVRDIYYSERTQLPVYQSSIQDPNFEEELQNPDKRDDPDTASREPDIVMNFGGIAVNIDADMIGTVQQRGSEITPSMQYHKSGAQTASLGVYRITSQASTANNSIQSCTEQIIYVK